MWDAVKGEVENVTTMGGFAEFGFAMNEKSVLKTGFGYVTSDNDNFDKPDAGMSVL